MFSGDIGWDLNEYLVGVYWVHWWQLGGSLVGLFRGFYGRFLRGFGGEFRRMV